MINKIKKFINKNIFPYLIIIILLGYIFLQRSCDSNKTITPKQSIVHYDTIYKPVELPSKIITKYKTIQGKEITIQGKIDTLYIKQFEKAADTTKTEMFIDATKIRQYTNSFNDSLADVSIFTETRGELLKIVPTVTIKARLPEKKTVFAVYGGTEVFNNFKFNNFGVKANLMFQNKKSDLFTGGYDTNETIYLGYNFRFLNIKK